jgi:hypothetical protein
MCEASELNKLKIIKKKIMKKITVLKLQSALLAFTICFTFLACQKNGLNENGNAAGKSSVNIYLTDDQSLVFDQVFLDIRKLEIKVEDSTEEEHESEHQGEADDNDDHGDVSGGWMSVSINPGVYDILSFRNGLDTLFATSSFTAAKSLKKVRLTLGSGNSVVSNGISSPLLLKDNHNFVVIKIDESMVQLNPGSLTNLWIDIDAGRSVRKHGNNFELKPSVKAFSKEKAGSLEGRVQPKDATAIILAISGTDTTSARPEDEGEFKFIGLKPGTYSLLYHATTNNYIDVTVNGIKVTGREEIKLGTTVLHK